MLRAPLLPRTRYQSHWLDSLIGGAVVSKPEDASKNPVLETKNFPLLFQCEIYESSWYTISEVIFRDQSSACVHSKN